MRTDGIRHLVDANGLLAEAVAVPHGNRHTVEQFSVFLDRSDRSHIETGCIRNAKPGQRSALLPNKPTLASAVGSF
jgi:hypothetical protein